MDVISKNTIDCLDRGYVRLESFGPVPEKTAGNYQGVTTLEQIILRSARVSYGNDLSQYSSISNLSLLEYLISMRHTSPFEMIEFCFEIKLPLSTAVHFLRHRTANVNMVSFRYTEAEDEDRYKPSLRLQDSSRRQCSSNSQIDESLDKELSKIQQQMEQDTERLFSNYQKMIDLGVAREVARFYLPNSTYTRMYWKLDLHNLLHFLSLRTASDAQYETRVYADAISKLITPLVPNVMFFYQKHRQTAVTLNSDEIVLFKKLIGLRAQQEDKSVEDCVAEVTKDMSKRKKDIFIDKIYKLL